jgi:NADH-quinone oxidoreductase subunit H
MQLLADAVKFLTKENFVPDTAKPLLYYAAPVFALIPGAVAFSAIPLSTPIQVGAFEMFGSNWGPYTFLFQGYDIGVGIVFILGVSSLAAYTLLMAGWGSGNKYSLMGALRASAQTISYELALGLSIVGVIMMYGTFNLTEMTMAQQGPLSFSWMGHTVTSTYLPNWGIFFQPLAALLFFSATFAESNRLPFDLAEGESELVAGFHTEYGGFKFNMFFIGEYGHMMISAGLMSLFFFGGFGIPYVSVAQVQEWATGVTSTAGSASALVAVLHFLSFMIKFSVFLWIFIWVRWTLPRFRYDQLMDLGWKTMLPWALGNTVLTAFVIYIASL